MSWAQLRTKTRTPISRKICCLKSGSQILNAVEQFSSLFSKDKLKQGAHVHQTHDPRSPRISWKNCRAVPSQQLLHVLCGAGTWRIRLGKKGLSKTKSDPVKAKQLFIAATDDGCAHAWGNGVCVPVAYFNGNSYSTFPEHVLVELLCGSQPTAPTCVVWT